MTKEARYNLCENIEQLVQEAHSMSIELTEVTIPPLKFEGMYGYAEAVIIGGITVKPGLDED